MIFESKSWYWYYIFVIMTLNPYRFPYRYWLKFESIHIHTNLWFDILGIMKKKNARNHQGIGRSTGIHWDWWCRVHSLASATETVALTHLQEMLGHKWMSKTHGFWNMFINHAEKTTKNPSCSNKLAMVASSDVLVHVSFHQAAVWWKWWAGRCGWRRWNRNAWWTSRDRWFFQQDKCPKKKESKSLKKKEKQIETRNIRCR